MKLGTLVRWNHPDDIALGIIVGETWYAAFVGLAVRILIVDITQATRAHGILSEV